MSLHIAVTADPYLPVPPRLYGGIERVIDLVVRGLVARGHRVTLLAHEGSHTPAMLIPYGVPPHRGLVARTRELVQVSSALVRLARRVDVIHSFGRLAALVPVLPLRTPKIQSYQREIPVRSTRRALRIAAGSLRFTGCSTSLYASAIAHPEERLRWSTVFNGVDVTLYRPVMSVAADAPLVFLGRIEAIKGTHHAIAIARQAGRTLIIAGNVSDRPYFDREVAPHLREPDVRYIGEVDDDAKNRLLGSAAALLMPIDWEEPFGIVMAEALACGTPVIGFRRGSVSEIVRDGVNGFVVDGPAPAAHAVSRLGEIDRRVVRADCEARFGHDAIVGEYERLYEQAVGAHG